MDLTNGYLKKYVQSISNISSCFTTTSTEGSQHKLFIFALSA